MCGECGTAAAPGNYDVSVKCCTCYDCGAPLGKDEKIPYADGKGNRSLYHRECEQKRRDLHMAEQLEKAELVPDYDGPVYCEGVPGGSFGDGYFSDVSELAETLDNEEDQSGRPEFAFCCTEHPFPFINLSGILESACDDMDEDAYERLDGVEELEAACAAFTEANKGVISWYEDRKHKVAVPPAEAS
jgi:hypothetical protein